MSCLGENTARYLSTAQVKRGLGCVPLRAIRDLRPRTAGWRRHQCIFGGVVVLRVGQRQRKGSDLAPEGGGRRGPRDDRHGVDVRCQCQRARDCGLGQRIFSAQGVRLGFGVLRLGFGVEGGGLKDLVKV
eukprot:1793100-Rhodomonas_salina.2